MSLQITSLNSGSNGNCYYVGNDQEGILIDAGICCREIEKRMKRLQLSIDKLKAIFVSHEHADHIKGIKVFSRKHQIPVYITDNTLRNGGIRLEKHLLRSFHSDEPVIIGALTVTAFPKFHDACDPYSFVISSNGVRVGVFTDIGKPCEKVIYHFKQCHAVFLESNYDAVMLKNGSYPYHLKKRISGGMGHLSNTQALDLFKSHRAPFLSHLFLSHLSENNNCPRLVTDLFKSHVGNVKLIVASRFQETPVYHIAGTTFEPVRKKKFEQLEFEFL